MARSALIDSLRSQAARDVAAAWEAARAEAARHAADLAAALARERRRLEQSLATDVQRVEAQGAAEAEHQARELGAAAAVALAERLLALARDELPRLCGTQRAALFEALAGELPPCRWESVRANPDDAALAARRFPTATVVSDPAISGGMDVTGENGRIDVDNTLETRLAIAWPDLLPELVAQVAVQSRAHGTAA